MLKWVRTAVVSAAALSMVVACAPNKGAVDNYRVNRTTPQYEVNQTGNYGMHHARRYDMNNWDGRTTTHGMDGLGMRDGRTGGMRGLHYNTRVEQSKDIAKRITSMHEVESANVFLTDRNAYVAVKLKDRKGTNIHTRSMHRTHDSSLRKHGIHNRTTNPTTLGTDGYMHRTHGFDGLGTDGFTRMHGYDGLGTDGFTNRMHGYDGLGTSMDGLTADIKAKIANEVKQLKPNVDNVYVSANPDFVQRMQGFANQIGKGHPIRGLVNEFNLMVERIFPTNATHDMHNQINTTPRTSTGTEMNRSNMAPSR